MKTILFSNRSGKLQTFMSAPRTPARARRRFQTPINNFLVIQTPEEKRKLLLQPKIKSPDMSASPDLRKKMKKKTGAKPRSSGGKEIKIHKPSKVAKIIKYFDEPQRQAEGDEEREEEVSAQRHPSQTEPVVSVYYPEMALPVGAAPSQWRTG